MKKILGMLATAGITLTAIGVAMKVIKEREKLDLENTQLRKDIEELQYEFNLLISHDDLNS